MLSILIPAYNRDVTQLVKDLHVQGVNAFIDFEILVLEDGSTLFLDENKKVEELPFCRYQRLEQNIGRSAIRNRLADMAKYDHLLFLDCDTALVNPNFLNKYLSFCSEETVVLGGTVYVDHVNKDFSLMHKYGSVRERNNTLNEVRKKKYPVFTTPNFLISRTIFQQIRFDEKIVGYGHEDTVFGIKLRRKGYDYYFIDNPVLHVGLETNPAFLKKSEVAIENLYKLYFYEGYSELRFLSRLLSTYIKYQKYSRVLAIVYLLSKRVFILHLCGKNPNLQLFDLYKLLYLCKFATLN